MLKPHDSEKKSDLRSVTALRGRLSQGLVKGVEFF